MITETAYDAYLRTHLGRKKAPSMFSQNYVEYVIQNRLNGKYFTWGPGAGFSKSMRSAVTYTNKKDAFADLADAQHYAPDGILVVKKVTVTLECSACSVTRT